MRAFGLMLAGIVLLALPATAALASQTIALPDKSDTIIMPSGSPLHFHAFNTENGATFDGPVMISGTYYYGNNPIDDGEPLERALYFMPDKASAARLPRFGDHGQPTSIFVENSTAFAKAVIPATTLAQFKRNSAKYVSGEADIWVDHFEVSIECDTPSFTAHFLSVAHPPQRLAMADMPDTGC
ncbi:MAG TPA: hypothetical protein VIJ85_03425 [Rhizomicrobium sp.]